jgi:GH24 family phage-related lysozyme (muramidase)
VGSSTGARGCESFSTEVQCCVQVACTASGKSGQCKSTCPGGTLVSGADGASGCGALPNEVRCCVGNGGGGSNPAPAVLPSGPSCVGFGRGGTCVRQCPSPFQWSTSASGSVTGCESFANDVKCCHPTATANSPSAPTGPISSNDDRVPAAAIAIIKQFEGFFTKAYPDPLSGNLPITIGWGSTKRRDGSLFRLGDTITMREAEDLLIWQVGTKYVPPMESSIPVWSSLNSNQRSALISFAYNLGASWYGNRNFASLTRVVRNREWSKIRATLLLYRNPGSNVEVGLRRRRNAEADLFLKPMTNAAGLLDAETVQEELSADEDEDMLDPSLHSNNTGVAIGLGVTGAVVVVALIGAVLIWVCVSKRDKNAAV